MFPVEGFQMIFKSVFLISNTKLPLQTVSNTEQQLKTSIMMDHDKLPVGSMAWSGGGGDIMFLWYKLQNQTN